MISCSDGCGLNFTKRSSFDWGSAAAPAAVRRALAPNTNVVARADVQPAPSAANDEGVVSSTRGRVRSPFQVLLRRQPDDFAQRRLRFEFYDLMRGEVDVVEPRGIQHRVVVRGDGEAGEQIFIRRNGRAAGGFPRFTVAGRKTESQTTFPFALPPCNFTLMPCFVRASTCMKAK